MNGTYGKVIYVGNKPGNEQQLDWKIEQRLPPTPKPKQSPSFMQVTRDDSKGSGPNAQPFLTQPPFPSWLGDKGNGFPGWTHPGKHFACFAEPPPS